MSDGQLRELHARFQATRSPEDEAAWLRARVRMGELAERDLEEALWLRELSKGSPQLKRLKSKLLSRRSAYVVSFEWAVRVNPGYRESFARDLFDFREDPVSVLPALRDPAHAEFMAANPGARGYRDPVPDLLRMIANPPPPGLGYKLLAAFLPGGGVLKLQGQLEFVWGRLHLHYPASDFESVWEDSLEAASQDLLGEPLS